MKSWQKSLSEELLITTILEKKKILEEAGLRFKNPTLYLDKISHCPIGVHVKGQCDELCKKYSDDPTL